jgi:hypothetical protein
MIDPGGTSVLAGPRVIQNRLRYLSTCTRVRAPSSFMSFITAKGPRPLTFRHYER